MADIVDSQTRSRMMAAIKGKNTKPEILVRKALHALGYRFRVHVRRLPGSPDIVLAKHRAAIFVNGCFWHGHECHLFRIPKTRPAFWKKKIEGNKLRDAEGIAQLRADGWRVLCIWECSLKGRTRLEFDKVVARTDAWLKSNRCSGEIRGSSEG